MVLELNTRMVMLALLLASAPVNTIVGSPVAPTLGVIKIFLSDNAIRYPVFYIFIRYQSAREVR